MGSHPSPRLCDLLTIRDGDVVTVIGAGGKHTLMLWMGRELADSGRSVVLTSTTNLHRSADYAALPTLVSTDTKDWQNQLGPLLSRKKHAVLVDSRLAPNMYKGFEPEIIARIGSSVPNAVVLVKADGARKRLIKAPSEKEPVYPPCTDLCILVLSLDALGKPLDDRHVHRLDRVQALTETTTVNPRTLVDVITGPGGYGERLPKQGRNVLYLSSCNSPKALEGARIIFDQTRSVFQQQLCGDTIRGHFLNAEVSTHD